MRLALFVLGTELLAIETGPESTHTSSDDDQDDDHDDAERARVSRARRSDRAGAGSTLAAAELGPTVLGFTAPWRHVERDDPEDTHGSVP